MTALEALGLAALTIGAVIVGGLIYEWASDWRRRRQGRATLTRLRSHDPKTCVMLRNDPDFSAWEKEWQTR